MRGTGTNMAYNVTSGSGAPQTRAHGLRPFQTLLSDSLWTTNATTWTKT